MTTYMRKLLGGVSAVAALAPVEDAGGAAVAAEQAATPPADPAAGQDHQAADAADAAGATREADDAEARGDPPAEPPKPRVPWQNKRIDKLTADARAAQERADAAEQRAREAEERARTYESLYGRPDPAPAAPGAAPAAAPAGGERTYTQKELEAEAARIANINRLNERIENVFDAGLKTKGADWNARVNAAAQAFGADLQQRPDFFEALTALPNPDAVYFELAGDLDRMAEVLAMPPVKLGMELATMAAKASGPARGASVSRVPAPINPLDGAAQETVPLEKMPMDDFVRQREKDAAARAAARR